MYFLSSCSLIHASSELRSSGLRGYSLAGFGSVAPGISSMAWSYGLRFGILSDATLEKTSPYWWYCLGTCCDQYSRSSSFLSSVLSFRRSLTCRASGSSEKLTQCMNWSRSLQSSGPKSPSWSFATSSIRGSCKLRSSSSCTGGLLWAHDAEHRLNSI